MFNVETLQWLSCAAFGQDVGSFHMGQPKCDRKPQRSPAFRYQTAQVCPITMDQVAQLALQLEVPKAGNH